MPGLSNIIEEFIKELFKEAEEGIVEIQRNELAAYFDCAPSQINYVLTTRFTPYKGYYIESRRGGGGYIRIEKVSIKEDENIKNLIIDTIGDSITKYKSYNIVEGLVDEGVITKREGEIIKVVLGDSALASVTSGRNKLRADILKNLLLVFVE